MRKYQVRTRYAGSILLEVEAETENQAGTSAEKIIQSMDSETFIEAMEPQKLDTEITELKEELTISVDERQLATILAALHFYQDENLRASIEIPDCKISDIATNCGLLIPLNLDEVNTLCERINMNTCNAKS